MIEAVVGQPIPLSISLVNGDITKFPRAFVYDASNVIVATIDLNHVASGLYRAPFTPVAAGHLCVRYAIFADAGRTTLAAGFERVMENLLVRALNQDAVFQKVLGHLGENVRDDVLSYDGNNRPLIIRRRIFPNKTLAENSTAGGTGEGEIATITGTAEHFDALKWESLVRVLE